LLDSDGSNEINLGNNPSADMKPALVAERYDDRIPAAFDMKL